MGSLLKQFDHSCLVNRSSVSRSQNRPKAREQRLGLTTPFTSRFNSLNSFLSRMLFEFLSNAANFQSRTFFSEDPPVCLAWRKYSLLNIFCRFVLNWFLSAGEHPRFLAANRRGDRRALFLAGGWIKDQ